MTIRRRVLAALGAVPLAGGALAAAPARQWAVMSLIGRELTTVTYQPSTGGRLNNNLRDQRRMPPPVLDQPAAQHLSNLLKRLQPGAVVGTIDGSDAEYDAQERLVQGGQFRVAPDLQADLQRGGFTHFVLLTRLRSDAALRTTFTYEGTGRLEGAGFYIDPVMPIVNLANGFESVGFLAPYVYFRIHLIELAGLRVLRQQDATPNEIVTNERGERGYHPATALTPAQRVEMLRTLVFGALDAALPALVGALPG